MLKETLTRLLWKIWYQLWSKGTSVILRVLLPGTGSRWSEALRTRRDTSYSIRGPIKRWKMSLVQSSYLSTQWQKENVSSGPGLFEADFFYFFFKHSNRPLVVTGIDRQKVICSSLGACQTESWSTFLPLQGHVELFTVHAGILVSCLASLSLLLFLFVESIYLNLPYTNIIHCYFWILCQCWRFFYPIF